LTMPMEGKADTHCHTKYSGMTKVSILRFPDSVSEPAAVVKAAERDKLNVLCVTDHNTIRGGMEAKKIASSVEIVVGEEVKTSCGDMIGIFLNENIKMGLTPEETVDLIHSQGGLAIAAHPFSAHCESLGMRIFDLKLDGVELFNAAQRDGYANPTAQKIVENKLNIAHIGASDAHTPDMVGNGFTIFEGTSAEDLRKAILQKNTKYGGNVTPLREFVWMTAITAAEMESVLLRSLMGRPMRGDSDTELAVSKIRTISKAVSIVGATAFMFPPFIYLTAVAGDRIHKTEAKRIAAKYSEQFKA
jgi:predicted metal-dependent phosphoesterase TrpH